MTGFWDSEEKIETVTRLWADGQSAGQIARTLGCSRNAVLGKVHRMGLMERPARGHGGAVAPKRPVVIRDRVVHLSAKQAKIAIARESHPDALKLDNGEPIRTADLMNCHCRWPHGEVGHPDFHYCGRAQKSGSSWCGFHAIRATTVAPPQPTPEAQAMGRKANAQFAKMWG